MKILVPMIVPDPFFPPEDYHFPKPLIEVAGEPMINRVVTPLRRHFPDAEFIFVTRADDCRLFDLDGAIRQIAPERAALIQVEGETKGAVCTCLLAIEHLDSDDELVIVNSDQIIDSDLGAAVAAFRQRRYDAGIITFDAVHPRWSYARVGPDESVLETAEKRIISRDAIAGFYYYARSSLFIEAATDLIRHGAHVNGAYYIAPTMNEIILQGLRVGRVSVASEAYHSFYSPAKIQEYERYLQRRHIALMSEKTATHRAPSVNVVIPMAGLGSRFVKAGYSKPKPFIDVAGSPMIERVMENLSIPGAHYLLLGQRAHFEEHPEVAAALVARGDVTLLPVDLMTEGAACTVMLARSLIDDRTPLLIANCDQIVDFDCAGFIAESDRRGQDGAILVFRDPERNRKWSFVRTDAAGLVQEAREKIAISDLATVGIYYFRRGRDYVAAAIDMIVRNDRSNNEFYNCPVYNYLIANGDRIGVHEIAPHAMHGVGTPEDLDIFLAGLSRAPAVAVS
jgi:NDP-sugar pyrophosphorylase family protein